MRNGLIALSCGPKLRWKTKLISGFLFHFNNQLGFSFNVSFLGCDHSMNRKQAYNLTDWFRSCHKIEYEIRLFSQRSTAQYPNSIRESPMKSQLNRMKVAFLTKANLKPFYNLLELNDFRIHVVKPHKPSNFQLFVIQSEFQMDVNKTSIKRSFL